MGNRALRKEAARLLKVNKVQLRLYKGKGNRFHHTASHLRSIIRTLSMKAGDVVHDCDAHNHVLLVNGSEFLAPWGPGLSRSGYFLNDEHHVPFIDGTWSCGCSPCSEPLSRDEIEFYWKTSYLLWKKYPNEAWPPSPESIELMEFIDSGGHAHDERGVLLPKWHAKLNPWAKPKGAENAITSEQGRSEKADS